MDAEGRVVVVTGAGHGIGREIALAFACRRDTVALAGRSESALMAVGAEVGELGGRALVVRTDVRDEDSVAELTRRVRDEFGHIDVLCANSGVTGPTAPLWDVTPTEWNETFAVNVFGTYLCCRAVLQPMFERRRGSILIIGSMTGKRPMARRAPYAASKMALVGLTRTLAVEAGAYGVRVNLVSPGPVAGPRLDGVIAREAAASHVPIEDVRAEMLADLALPRFVEAADVAAAAVFLAGDGAAAITGADLNVASGGVMY